MKQTVKEKVAPKMCVCGKAPVQVKSKNGKMLSCPDPVCCPGNLRTRWCRHIDTATAEWNAAVSSFKFRARTVKE